MSISDSPYATDTDTVICLNQHFPLSTKDQEVIAVLLCENFLSWHMSALFPYASVINDLPLRSAKFHQLQIVKGTRMEKEYEECPQDFERFALDEYLDFFVDMLERLRPDLYIERFAGEVPPRFVNETPWGLIRNTELLRLLDKRLEERDTWQGRLLMQ